MGEAYLLVAAHENVHDIAANNREGYAKMESIVMDTLESLGLDEETLMDVQRALAQAGYTVCNRLAKGEWVCLAATL